MAIEAEQTMRFASALIGLMCVSCAAAQSPWGAVKTCAQITQARPGLGVSYKGTVKNDDYRLVLSVPSALTAWGAAPDAPFHGFVMYLPSGDGKSSCIGFTVYLYVELGIRRQCHFGDRVVVAGTPAWEEKVSGRKNRTEFTNISVSFSYALRDGRTFDAAAWFVTPTQDLAVNKPIFEDFLSKIQIDSR
jgi:hypothetical protein